MLPDVPLPPPGLTLQEFALLDDQLIVADPSPLTIEAGLAEILTVGAGIQLASATQREAVLHPGGLNMPVWYISSAAHPSPPQPWSAHPVWVQATSDSSSSLGSVQPGSAISMRLSPSLSMPSEHCVTAPSTFTVTESIAEAPTEFTQAAVYV